MRGWAGVKRSQDLPYLTPYAKGGHQGLGQVSCSCSISQIDSAPRVTRFPLFHLTLLQQLDRPKV